MTTYTREEREFWERVFVEQVMLTVGDMAQGEPVTWGDVAQQADKALEEWRKRFSVTETCDRCKWHDGTQCKRFNSGYDDVCRDNDLAWFSPSADTDAPSQREVELLAERDELVAEVARLKEIVEVDTPARCELYETEDDYGVPGFGIRDDGETMCFVPAGAPWEMVQRLANELRKRQEVGND